MSDIQPASPSALDAEVSQIARDLIVANQAMKGWKERQKALKTRLTKLWSAGVAPTEFSEHDYNFVLQGGKKEHSIDDEGKEQQKRLLAQLVAEGHAELKTGDPFWVARKAPKPKAAKTKSTVSAIDSANPSIIQR